MEDINNIIARLHELQINNLSIPPPVTATIETLEQTFSQLTVNDIPYSSSPPSSAEINNFFTPPPVTATVENLEQTFSQLTTNDIPYLSSLPSSAVPAAASSPNDDLGRLFVLDQKLDCHMKSIIHSLDTLSSPNISSQCQVEVNLGEEKCWLHDAIRELHGLLSHRDADIQVLAEAMRERMVQFTSAIDLYVEILRKRSPPQSSPYVVNTGNVMLPIHLLLS
jgi:hypothetical protein